MSSPFGDTSSRGTDASPSKGTSAPLLAAPILVNLPQTPGQKDQEPVFYPLNMDSLDTDKDLPPSPPRQSSLPASPPRSASPPAFSPPRSSPLAFTPPRCSSPPPAPPRASEPETNVNGGTENATKSNGRTELPQLPEAPPSRLFGQGYSSHNPVPTVQHYRSEKAKQEEEAQEYAALVERRRQEAEERETNAASMNAPQGGSVSDTKQVAGEETNAAKTQKGKKNKASANAGATEKERMMDQMNANQREFTHSAQLVLTRRRETDG